MALGYIFVILFLIAHCIERENCVTIVRSMREEKLSCSSTLDCKQFNSRAINGTTCGCDGTFIVTDQGFVCTEDSGNSAGCNFYFDKYKDTIQLIAVEEFAYEFLNHIITDVKCKKMELLKVEMVGSNLKWMQVTNEFEISSLLITPGTTNYYIRWKDANNVNPKTYTGQLLKFSLLCTKTDGSGVTNGCLMGRIKGERSWDKANIGFDVCNPPKSISSTTTSTTSNIRPSTPGVLPSKTTTPKKEKTVASSNKGMITGLIAGIVILIVILIIIGMCFLRRRRLQRLERAKQNEPIKKEKSNECIYEKIDGSQQFENASYLTSLNSSQKNNNLATKEETYASPYENNVEVENSHYKHPKNSTKLDNNQIVSSSPHDYVPIDAEYTALNELKVPFESPKYQRLSTSDDVTGYEDMKNGDQDDEYTQISH